MRIYFLSLSVFLFLLILNSNAYSQPDTGSTVINATISGDIVLNMTLEHPEIFIPEDYYFYENLTLYQIDYHDIDVYLNKTDGNDFVKFANETQEYVNTTTLNLPNYTYENVTIQVYVPSGMGYDGGTYYIPIYVSSLNDSRSNTTTLKVHVNASNPVDDIEIINIYPSSLYPGESLNVDISIHKIYPTETTDIQICYCINENSGYSCGPSSNNYGCSWKAITEWLNYTKTVTVNQGAGTYYFIVAVSYPGDSNIKRANSPQFYVRATPSEPSGDGDITGITVTTQPELVITSPEYIEASPGDRISFDVEIRNTGNADASNTTLDIYGIPQDWISITPSKQDIEAGGSKKYSVSISLPRSALEQVYSLFAVAKSGSVETTKSITFTVAFSLEKRAEFLLEEADSKKEEAEGVIEKAKGFGLDTSDPEKTLTDTNRILEESKNLFDSGDYEESIEKSKEAIEGYKSVTDSVKGAFEKAYFSLLEEIMSGFSKVQHLTEEKNTLDSISLKINGSSILQREERPIEAYETLLEAKQLLNQLMEKIYFRDLAQNIIIISIIIIVILVVSFFLFYRKKMSRFTKILKIEEHKKSLRQLFKKEIRPSITYKERPLYVSPKKKVEEKPEEVKKPAPPPEEEEPKIDREKVEEISRLLKEGAKFSDIDIHKAKEAFMKVREIYNSMTPEEKKLIDQEIIKIKGVNIVLKRKTKESK